MRIGIPRESKSGETLVAATPATATQLMKLGYEVVIEAGAGGHADQPDSAYAAAGVTIADAATVWSSDVVAKINAPTDDEIAKMRRGVILISIMAPGREPELVEKLRAAGKIGRAHV